MKARKCKPYDWETLKHDTKIRKEFIIIIKKGFSALQNSDASSTSPINTRYTQFEKVCKEAANKVILLKPKSKKRIPWETAEICQKRDILHKVAKLKDSAITIVNIYNYFKAQTFLENSHDLEQKKYIDIKINEIQTAATNKKSALAWKLINEVSRRNKSNKGKLKATIVIAL